MKEDGKEVKAEKPVVQKTKKRESKRDKTEKVLDKFCETISKSQQESDRLFVALEEKQMKLDYDLMELERERQREESAWLEIRRKEEREFQLHLFSMVCQGSGSRGAMPYMPDFYSSGQGSWKGHHSSDDNSSVSDH